MGKHMIFMRSIISRTENLITGDLDGETVLMRIESGKYFGMDKIGSRIWGLIESPVRIDDLCSRLLDEFDVDLATCERDVLRFLEKLADSSLIRVYHEPDA